MKYHVDTNSYICRYVHYEKNCVVKYCKTCRRDNNYFCEECLPADYEVNPITGACVKKIFGPTLMMRGLTNSQINSGHAFLVYLIFQIKYTRRNLNRNLAEEKKVPTICQIIDSVDETEDELNFVEYECIGNLTEDENEEMNVDYQVNGIEENSADNNGVLRESNLNNIANDIDFEKLEQISEPKFSLGDMMRTSIFNISINNYTSDNLIFDISIEGNLTNELEPKTIDASIPVTHLPEPAKCKFNIKENKKANLNCKLNIEQYKQYSTFSFKTVDIDNDGSHIYLSRLNEIYLLNKHEDSKDDNNLIKIIIPVIVGVVVIAGIVIAVIIHKRNKRNKRNKINMA